MKKPVLLIATNAMIVIVIFLLLAQSLFLVQRGAQVASTEGQISVQRRGQTEFIPLGQGEIVGIGDTIVTQEDGSATFTFADRTRWKTTPNSQITIRKASVDSINKSEISQLRLDSGQVFVRMVKPLSSGSSFEIQTPNALVKVTGTVLSVKSDEGRTQVEVLKGLAEIEAEGKIVAIKAGHEGIVNVGKVEIKKSDCQQLAAQNDLIKPTLEFGLGTTEDEKSVSVSGVTETGNRVIINHKSVATRPNGGFMHSFPVQNGHNQFVVQVIDKHGASSSECRAVKVNLKTKEMIPSSCH
jgi:hypothetical protein